MTRFPVLERLILFLEHISVLERPFSKMLMLRALISNLIFKIEPHPQ